MPLLLAVWTLCAVFLENLPYCLCWIESPPSFPGAVLPLEYLLCALNATLPAFPKPTLPLLGISFVLIFYISLCLLAVFTRAILAVYIWFAMPVVYTYIELDTYPGFEIP